MSLMEHIGGRIRDLREAFGGEGLSQDALAKMLGVAPNTVSRWETANYKPSIMDLQKLAEIFSVSILEFFPSNQEAKQKKGALSALLRAAENLPENDLNELRKYAEFRRARTMYKSEEKPRRGRKTKE